MPYRIEEASTGRAGCKNKECLDNKEKILKGELRLGTWIETSAFQSWAWRHWGCVTPKQISNLQTTVGDDKDYSQLDGYEEISEESQEKIREAIDQGHVADSDWRGDVEVNRPGKTGFRARASKKKDDEKTKDSKKGGKPVKSRGKTTKEPEDEEHEEHEEAEEEVTAPKKAKAAAEPKKRKRGAAQENGEDGDVPKAKGAKRGRKSGKASKDDAPSKDSKAADTESPKASRARRAADRAAKKP